jgi:hypothetical protein
MEKVPGDRHRGASGITDRSDVLQIGLTTAHPEIGIQGEAFSRQLSAQTLGCSGFWLAAGR